MELMTRNQVSEVTTASQAGPQELDYINSYGMQQPAEEDSGILLRLRRRKFLFATVFISTLALVAGAYMYVSRVYKAEAVITVTPADRVIASQEADGQQATVGDSADLESQSVILTSPTLLRELLSKPEIKTALLQECEAAKPPAWKQAIKDLLQYERPPSCEDQFADTTSMVSSLRGRLVVGSSGRSRILSLSFSSPSPAVAQAIVNGVVQVYLDSRTSEKLQPRDQAIEWLHGETGRIADRLKQTEAQIQVFLQAKGVVRGQVAPLASEQLTGLAQQIGLAEAERASAAGRLQQAASQGGATSGVLADRNVNDVKLQLSTVSAQIAALSNRYGSANPVLTELQEQRRGLERLLSQGTSLVTKSATSDFQSANSRVLALRQQLDQAKQEVRGNDNATTQVAALERNVATDRELFLDLTKNLNQLETARRLVTPNARLVSWAELPQGVFFPKATTFGLTGLLLATGFAAAAALLRDRADHTVRNAAGLQNAADLPVLARIPHVPRVGRNSSNLGERLQRPSAFQEAIRGLYAECLLLGGRHGERDRMLRSFLVTSSEKQEGKSFTVMALAHFAAAAGQRVLLIEGDLRRPGIGPALSLHAQQGVTEVLRGHAEPADVIQPSSFAGLDVILAGRTAMDSAELLASPRMAQLLAWGKTHYDLVLVDTPPSRVLPDARILAPYVDGVLYCAQWGLSHTASVVEGVREIRAAGGRVRGLILDGVHQPRYQLYDKRSTRAGSYMIAQQH
jgi:succinoglycan biosynthesis transport protein ExoP